MEKRLKKQLYLPSNKEDIHYFSRIVEKSHTFLYNILLIDTQKNLGGKHD